MTTVNKQLLLELNNEIKLLSNNLNNQYIILS